MAHKARRRPSWKRIRMTKKQYARFKIENEICDILAEEIRREIDREILATLMMGN